MTRQAIFDILMLGTCAYAFWRGGVPERIASATLFLGDILTVLVASEFNERFRQLEVGIFLIDLLVLASLAWVAMRSTRWWPLILAGLQVDAVVVHTVRLAAPDSLAVAYMNAIALWAYPMQLLLAAGAWRHQRRLRELGTDPPWNRPTHRSTAA